MASASEVNVPSKHHRKHSSLCPKETAASESPSAAALRLGVRTNFKVPASAQAPLEALLVMSATSLCDSVSRTVPHWQARRHTARSAHQPQGLESPADRAESPSAAPGVTPPAATLSLSQLRSLAVDSRA